MNIIIMGCGRVGEQLCRFLSSAGHQITVIDPSTAALEHLGPEFKGRKIKGIGFDRDVLLQAGIATADAFAATSASDNANILAARIARNIFSVPRVVARLYDPRRAEIYERLGLRTISSTTWGAERIMEMLVHTELDPLMSFGNGEVKIVEIEIPGHWSGRQVKQLIVPGEINVISITRKGKAFLPILGTELHPDDRVHLAVVADAMDRFNVMFGFGEGD
jgi:trk system potassium uptake protein TrkA